LSSFFAAVVQLEGDPSDNSLRQGVLSAAGSMAQNFASSISQLAEQQGALNTESQTIVSQVNALTTSIASLDQQIQALDPKTDAGTLEDQRQYDLNQLSQFVGINQLTTESNGLTVTTTNGALLVSEGKSFALSGAPVGGVSHYYDSQGHDISTALASGGGQLGGYLAARDQDIPQVENALDALAGALATKLNSVQQSGTTGTGAPAAGIPLFNIPTAGGLPGWLAGGISIAITDPSLVAAGALGAGSSDGSNAVLLASVQNSPLISLVAAGSPYQVTTAVSPTDFYAGFVGTLGSLVAETSTLNTAQQASLAQTQTQRDSLSAVNTNDEASSLALLERSYEASSKVFTILDTVFASVLNLGEQTTVA
jgi:flagellar hook-associated protein 1 FlgK